MKKRGKLLVLNSVSSIRPRLSHYCCVLVPHPHAFLGQARFACHYFYFIDLALHTLGAADLHVDLLLSELQKTKLYLTPQNIRAFSKPNIRALTPRLYFFYRERDLASPGAKLICVMRIIGNGRPPARTLEKFFMRN